jgi:hypothetical protein
MRVRKYIPYIDGGISWGPFAALFPSSFLGSLFDRVDTFDMDLWKKSRQDAR